MSQAKSESVKALFAEVSSLSNQLRKGLDDADSVRLGSKSILGVLGGDGPLTVPEIARVRSTSRQNIQMLVNRLEAEGSVELVSNPAHQRSALVRITDQGRTLLAVAGKEETKSLEKLLPQVSEAELLTAIATLRRMRGLLSDEKPTATVRRERPALKLEAWRNRREKPLKVAPPRSAESAIDVADSPVPAAKKESEDDFPVNLL